MTAQRPALTIVIPTRNRHDLVGRAVTSALGQTLDDIEVLVVDDGSVPPLALPAEPGLRCIRNEAVAGQSAARNLGIREARGRWVTFLGDDDELLPHMAATAIDALTRTTLPPPVALLSAMELVRKGRVRERRIPPTYPRGSHFPLERLPRGRSEMTKNTLVVERDLIDRLGGFDETMASKDLSDMLVRLNPVCSILGIPTVTYRMSREPGSRLSRNSALLEEGVTRFIEKHRDLLAERPRAHADVLLGQARMATVAGPRRAVLPSIARAFRVAPGHTAAVLLNPIRMARALAHLGTSG